MRAFDAYERYRNDPQFMALVNTIYGFVHTNHNDFTAYEFRVAMTLALEKHDSLTVQPAMRLP